MSRHRVRNRRVKPSSQSKSDHPTPPSYQAAADSEGWHLHILGRLSETMRNMLHPSLYERTLREIGVGLGRDVVEQVCRSRTVPPSSSQEDFLRCLRWLKTSLNWHHAVEEVAKDRIRVSIPHCPLGRFAAENPHLCQLEAGLLGGIAGDLFDYAKVAIDRGPEVPPTNCYLTVHLERTPESLVVEGPRYPLEHHMKKEPQVTLADTLNFDELSPRERQIVRLIGEGLSDKEIAATLNLSVRTAEGHSFRIREKTGLKSRSALIRWAIKVGNAT